MKYLILITIILASCSSLVFLGYKNLGNHYFLYEDDDHYQYSIIWNDNDSYAKEGEGTLITDPAKWVVKYNFNSGCIIAKTIQYNSNDSICEYWFIDKTKTIDLAKTNFKSNFLIGPLDSNGLFKYLDQKKIALKLIDVPKH